MRVPHLFAPLLLLAASLFAAFVGSAPEAAAEGWNLDGRQAPNMTFPAGGVNGVAPGTSLSQYRGRVVLVKFWLRDCPICRRALPEMQTLHARWGRQGLVVLTVLHKFGPSDPALNQFLQQNGYTFPVASDPDGRQAAQFGVNVRPTDYIVGIDGLVKASNGAPESILLQELGRYRLSKVDPLPASMKEVRDAVWRGEVAAAFRQASAAASAADAPSEVKAALPKVATLAEEDIAGRAAWAASLTASRRAAEAKQVLDQLAADYRGTSLEARAATAK